MDEYFKFAERYLVSRSGEIVSLHCKNSIVPQRLKQNKVGEYLGVNIMGKPRTTHRIVAKAFVPNPENKPFVNHKDGNKHNNHASNLEWCTRSENQLHAYRVLGVKNSKSNLGNYYGASFNSRRVKQLTKAGLFMREFDCIRRAQEELGVSETSIGNCLAGRSKSAGGFLWEYA